MSTNSFLGRMNIKKEPNNRDRTEAVIHSFPLRFTIAVAAIVLYEFAFMMTVEKIFHGTISELAQAVVDGVAIGLLFAIFCWFLLLKPLLVALRSDRALLIHKQEALENEVESQDLNKKLAKAFSMAEMETSILSVFQRAVKKYVPDLPIELLLADSSHAHMRQASSTFNPVEKSPANSSNQDKDDSDGIGDSPVDKEMKTLMCNVATPFDCPATRYSAVQVNKDSQALDACPVLVQRSKHPVSALCVPVNVAGKTVGVIHSDLDKKNIDISNTASIFSLISSHLGTRLGLVRALDTAQQAAMTDPLTGTLNRRSLEDQCDTLLMGGKEFSLVVADIDHFKKLNDTYSHAVGDRSLKVFASTLRKCCREEDMVARLGGEEFCIVLLGISSEKAVGLLERIRDTLPESLAKAGLPEFTASFGVSDTNLANSLEALMKISDHAMYKAKQAGRNKIVVGSSQLENE